MSMTTEPGAEGIVGVRAAAKMLKLNPSTVSRYLQDHPALNLGNTTRPKVDVEQLRRHRDENVDPARRGSHAGQLMGEGDAARATGPEPDFSKAYRRARASSATSDAQSKRLDLDVKKKLLVPLAEVEAGIVDAGLKLLQALLELGSRLGDELAGMESPNEIAARLETEHRELLHEFHDSLAVTAASLRAEKGDDPKA
jgi:hypothetical protein